MSYPNNKFYDGKHLSKIKVLKESKEKENFFCLFVILWLIYMPSITFSIIYLPLFLYEPEVGAPLGACPELVIVGDCPGG